MKEKANLREDIDGRDKKPDRTNDFGRKSLAVFRLGFLAPERD